MKQNNKAHILFRYGLITMIFLLFSGTIIVKLFKTTVLEADEWNERMRIEMSKVDTIAPERGSILASNGNILACNLTVYDIKLDLRHPDILARESKGLNMASIDSLADSLDYYYPRIKDLHKQHPDTIAKYSWHKRLKAAFDVKPQKRTRALRIAAKKSIEDFNRIRNFPYLKTFEGSGREIPVYTEAKNLRIYPYGDMARLSVGRVYEKTIEIKSADTTAGKSKKKRYKGEIRGYAGLEKALDTLLFGKPGLYKKVALNNGMSNWVSKPAQRGYDILTTIDIDIQDILEEELLKVCGNDTTKAEWGTAIIMEVATGEIKAISNIEKENGKWVEAMNRAVVGYEPGSVMKAISLMIALEDGLVKNVDGDMVSCAPFQGTSDPHGSGMKNMKKVIAHSSNTGISRVIFRGYADDPSKFHDRLASIGFFEPLNSGIGGEQIPNIRKLLPKDSKGRNITMTARHLDLARQAFGYNTEIPPIYTLAYYNAIANNGRFMRPHLVKALIDENGKDSVLPDAFVRQVCSERTAKMIKECLHEVVWGEGTARSVQDERVEIAGKTGTVKPYDYKVLKGYDESKRRISFAGFFPYENPIYSCIVVIQLPANHGGAGGVTGRVLKNVALKLYSRGMLNNHSTYSDTRKESSPVFFGSTDKRSSAVVADELNIRGAKSFKTDNNSGKGEVPSVIGLDVASAVRMLEEAGLNVKITGSGYVAAQSIEAGSPIVKGKQIILTLTL